MPLPAGSRLGPYEVVSPIGAGGMGEVYRAVDTRLGRSVAIKILPERLSSQPERLPRRFGIASHIGVVLSVPSVGCAKKRLVGEHAEPGPNRGDWAALTIDGETVGAVLRTRPGVKPVFVSPGHRADLASSIDLVLRFCSRYRLPDPARRAHQLTREIRRGSLSPTPGLAGRGP